MNLKKLKLENFLSFGKTEIIEFSKLNTIVGPNNSGKTNVFRAINLVHEIMKDTTKVPSEIYYHDKNLEKPFVVELEITLNKEEKEALHNFFICSCLYNERGVDRRVEERKRIILEKILQEKGKNLFEEFSDTLTIVATSTRTNYPAELYFKFHKNNNTIFCANYHLSKTVSKKGGYSIYPMSEIILDLARKKFSTLNGYIDHGKGKIPSFQSFNPSLFSAVYDGTNEDRRVEFEGFQLKKYESRHENRPEFIRLRNFIYKINPDEDGATLRSIISLVFTNAITKTSDIRSRPKPILNLQNLEFQQEMINISGENLAKILFSMNNNPDPKIKAQFSEIKQQFKKITKNLELDLNITPVSHTVLEKKLGEFENERGFMLNGAKQLGTIKEEKTITQQGISIQIIKNEIPIPLEFTSAGIIELVSSLTALIGQKNKIILLDEPALNLHSILQRKVLQLIQDAVTNKNNQVILITHSPFMVTPENFQNTWKCTISREGTHLINLNDILEKLSKNDVEKTIQRLHNSEVRSILFQHGVVFVEGPSDRMVLEKVDRHMTDRRLEGPNIEENEWQILDVGGKDSMTLLINLAKNLQIPHIAIFDYDSLMQCTGKIQKNGNDVRTSSVIYYISRTDELSESEQKTIENLEKFIVKKQKKNNENKIQYWYNEQKLDQLNQLALSHNMYVLTKDLEGVIRSTTTPRDSKPLKALETITESLSQNIIPSEIKSVMKFIKSRIEKQDSF